MANYLFVECTLHITKKGPTTITMKNAIVNCCSIKRNKETSLKVKDKGTTIIPVKLYFNERSFIKLEIAIARGKKKVDKRNSIKEKDQKR